MEISAMIQKLAQMNGTNLRPNPQQKFPLDFCHGYMTDVMGPNAYSWMQYTVYEIRASVHIERPQLYSAT